MVSLHELVSYANTLLETARFRDYCPNGLQVEGRPAVQRLVSGVTASQALLDAAIEAGADAILVHHGYFWKGEDPTISGMKRRRIKTLLDADVSLLAYHLPLDAHPRYGNNACLAARLGIEPQGRFGREGLDIGMYGSLPQAAEAADFVETVAQALQRVPLHIAGSDRPIRSIAWCTGAAQSYIEDAVGLGVDAFLTGEASEQTVHVARENGLHFFAAGHHATERYGVQALGAHLGEHFRLEHCFIDADNPV